MVRLNLAMRLFEQGSAHESTSDISVPVKLVGRSSWTNVYARLRRSELSTAMELLIYHRRVKRFAVVGGIVLRRLAWGNRRIHSPIRIPTNLSDKTGPALDALQVLERFQPCARPRLGGRVRDGRADAHAKHDKSFLPDRHRFEAESITVETDEISKEGGCAFYRSPPRARNFRTARPSSRKTYRDFSSIF